MKSQIDMLTKRRSVRSYQNTPVEKELVDTMVRAALLSPTSKGIHSRCITVVDDPGTIATLAECKAHGADFLPGAPLALVVAADTERASAWIEDASIAAITIQYAAEELGLSSCWIQIRGRTRNDGVMASDYIKRTLSLPESMEVEVIVSVGYAAETLEPHSDDELSWDSIRYNSYQKPYFG
jgi:nitroreductase